MSNIGQYRVRMRNANIYNGREKKINTERKRGKDRDEETDRERDMIETE